MFCAGNDDPERAGRSCSSRSPVGRKMAGGATLCRLMLANPDDSAHPSANAPMVMNMVMKILTSVAMARPPDGAPPRQRQLCVRKKALSLRPQSTR